MYILTVSKFNIEWEVEFCHFNHVLKFLSKNKNKNQCFKVIKKNKKIDNNHKFTTQHKREGKSSIYSNDLPYA